MKYLPLIKEEVNRLVNIRILEPTKHATHAALYFIHPKKDGTIRFLINFRELNRYLICEPFLLPKINEMIQRLNHFTYTTILDLSIGYYYLPLDKETSDLYSICLPFSIYRYKHLL